MADIFDVIADATRRELLDHLREAATSSARGELSVGELVERMEATQPTVSKHLKVLRDAGLASVREEGQHRYYSLSPSPLDAVDDWLVPFLVDEDADAAEAAAALPDSAAHAADLVGRAAASAKHVVTTALKKLPGR